MDSILVTGGCGFIGRNLIRRIRDRRAGEIVLVVDDLSQGMHPDRWLAYEDKQMLSDHISCYDNQVFFVQSDIIDFFKRDRELVDFLSLASGQKISRTFREVFHFASIVGGRMQLENERLFVARNLCIDTELFYWASQRKPGHLLYPSSSAVYPVAFQTEECSQPLRESLVDFEALRRPDLTYGWSKLNGEYLAGIYADQQNLKVTCVRPFSGYGPDQDGTYPIPAIVSRFREQQDPLSVWGTGRQSRDFIYIDDLLDGIEIAMSVSEKGVPINLGTGIETTFIDVISQLKQITSHDPVIQCEAEKPVGVFSRFADISYMKMTLDWTPKISLNEGLVNMLSS